MAYKILIAFRRDSAVNAWQLTADPSTFMLDFNRGRTGYPAAVDNGKGVYIVTGPGAATEVQLGAWVVEMPAGVEVHADADFHANFCLVAIS